MKIKTVYQTDQYGFFLYPTDAHELPLSPGDFNIPYGAYEGAPPVCAAGLVARRTSDGWVAVEDHRRDQLFVLDGSGVYEMGSQVEVDGESVTYDGGGPVPSWLTADAPVPPIEPEVH